MAMATSRALLAVLATLAVAPVLAAAGDVHLHFYLHDVVSGSNPTAVQIIKGPGSSTNPVPGTSFGDTTVMDDVLTSNLSATSAAVGRAQGFYMQASLSSPIFMVCVTLVFTSGDYNGSTIVVIGRDDTMGSVREMAVVGGTGQFRMATGYVLWKTASMSGADATVEVDVYATTPNATVVAPAPDDSKGSNGASGASPGSAAASAAAAVRGFELAHACVVAVVVVVLGCVW